MNLADIRWRVATATPPAVAHAIHIYPDRVVTFCGWQPTIRGHITTWNQVLGLPAHICTNCASQVGLPHIGPKRRQP